VLQTLFEFDFSVFSKDSNSGEENKALHDGVEGVEQALRRNLKEFAPGLEGDDFVFSLMRGVLTKRILLDEIIEKAAPEWPIDKISVIDRNILRIGLYELLFGDRGQVPPKVAINEAIELAKTFGGENSGKFVNGVLGAVYKEIGEPGKEQKSKMGKGKEGEVIDKSTLHVETLGGALVYAKKPARPHDGSGAGGGGEILFALVHDVFGYWTLSKGKVEEGETVEEATKRAIKKEIGLDIDIKDRLGENEYIASLPEKGKTLKRVTYFLAESEYRELTLEESGGLDASRWFNISSVPELRMYSDMIPVIEKAIEILSSKNL